MLPALNSYGLFALLTPFTISSSINYTVTKLNLISALVENNIDVYNTYYAANGLSSTIYQTDLANNVAIVTFESVDGPTINVPSSYISNVPVQTAVPYSQLVLSIDLGLLPDTLDLTQLLSDLQTIANNYVGVTSTPKLHRVMGTAYSYSESATMETVRKAQVADYISFYTGKVNSDTALAAANLKINMLQETIISLRAQLAGQ